MRKPVLETEFENDKDSPGLLLWKLSSKWQAQQRSALEPFDLTHVQFVLLASLTFAIGQRSFTQKQLAEHAQTDEMMTSQVIRRLITKGLVTREKSKSDGRAFIVTPTNSGIKLVNQAVKAVEQVDKKLFSKLSVTDQETLMALMTQLITASPPN